MRQHTLLKQTSSSNIQIKAYHLNGQQCLAVLDQGELFLYRYSLKEQWQLIFQKEPTNFEDYPYSLELIHGIEENYPFLLLRNAIGYDCYRLDEKQGIIPIPIARDKLCGGFQDEQKSDDIAYFGNFMQSGCNQVLFRYFPQKPIKPAVKFYFIGHETLKNCHQPLQKFALSMDSSTTSAFTQKNNRFYFADVEKQGKTAILIENDSEWKIYELSTKTGAWQISCLADVILPEKIPSKDGPNYWLFGNFTQNDSIDFLCVNKQGRTLYQYQKKIKQLIRVHHDLEFSSKSGWEDKHRASAQVIISQTQTSDQLASNGPPGLELSIFHRSSRRWESKLTPLAERYPSFIRVVNHENLLLASYPEKISLLTFNEDKSALTGKITPTSIPIIKTLSLPITEKKEIEHPRTPGWTIPIKDSGLNLPDIHISEIWPSIVNPFTGKAELSIPLLKPTKTHGFNITLYHHGRTENSILGASWRLHEDLIIFNNQGNAYYWFINGNLIFLVCQKTQNDKEFYSIRGCEAEIQIHYNRCEKTWQIQLGKTHRIYQSAPGALKSWRIHQVWMQERLSLEYVYSQTSGDYLLTEIKDTHKNNLSLHYDKKLENYYLARLLLKRDKEEQPTISFIFNYEKSSDHNSFLLKSINQEKQRYNRQVISFDYKAPHLEKITFPAQKSVIELFYKKIALPHLQPMRYTINTQDQFQFHWIGDYILLSEIRLEGSKRLILDLRMQSPQSPGKLKSAWENELEPMVIPINEKMEYYQIYPQASFFALLIKYQKDENRELYLFCKNNNPVWKTKPVYTKISIGKIVTGINFLVYAESAKKINVWTYNGIEAKFDKSIINSPSKEIKEETCQRFALTSTAEAFGMYDDVHLWVAYQLKAGEWTTQIIDKIPGQLNALENVIEKFILDDSTKNNILGYFYRNLIYFFKNSIGIVRIHQQENKLYCHTYLWIINPNYQMQAKNEFKFLQEDILKSNRKLSDGYSLKYETNNNQFRSIVIDSFGKTNSELTHYYRSELLKNILFSLDKYVFIPSGEFACFGQKKIILESEHWKSIEESEQKSISKELIDEFILPLADQFILSRQPGKNFQLYRQTHTGKKDKACLFDFKVSHGNQLFNAYPDYIAYNQGDEVKILPFKNKTEIADSYVIGEGALTAYSRPQLLVLANKSDQLNRLQLYTYPNLHLEAPLEDLVVSHIKAGSDDHDLKEIKYDYDPASAIWRHHQIFYQKKSNNTDSRLKSKSLGDFPQEIKDKPVKITRLPKETKKLLPILNKKKVSDKPKIKTQHAEEIISEMISDRENRWTIAEFFIGKVKNDEVSFLGFESYEQSGQKWKFDREKIVTDRWSLTGKSYLYLPDSKTQSARLEASFCPTEQNDIYEVTCWLQAEQDLPLGDFFTGCSLLVSNDSKVVQRCDSQVQRKIGQWAYLKSSIDLGRCRADLGTTRALKIQIIVEAGKNNALKIDHIRFSPSGSQFLASVYDADTGLLSHRIDEDGSISCYFYQDNYRYCSIVNMNDDIEFFLLDEKEYTSSYHHQETSLSPSSSSISIKPHRGFHERFDESAWNKRWRINTSSAWQVAPGQLLHQREQKDELKLLMTDLDTASVSLRVGITLAEKDASLQIKWGGYTLLWTRENDAVTCYVNDKKIKQGLNFNFGIVICYERPRLCLWIDTHLVFDQSLLLTGQITSEFDFNLTGKIHLSQVFVFDRASIRIIYYDIWRRPMQEIEKCSADTVNVIHYLYDAEGHLAITTKSTRLSRAHSQSLMDFYPDFVTNAGYTHTDSVWKTGRLRGLVNQGNSSDEGYNYYRLQYALDASDQIITVGKPGRLFSILSDEKEKNCITRFSSKASVVFLNTLFPPTENYIQKQQIAPNNSRFTRVYNAQGQLVAGYIQGPHERGQLVTYEYDELGRMVLLLPPAYHEKSRVELKPALGWSLLYDEDSNIIEKTTPDTGKTGFVHNPEGRIRFKIDYAFDGRAEGITDYGYDEGEELVEVSHSSENLTRAQLEELARKNLPIPGSTVRQIYYRETVIDQPTGKLARIQYSEIRDKAGKTILAERLYFGEDKQLRAKAIKIADVVHQWQYQRAHKKLISLSYPASEEDKGLQIVLTYDHQGLLTGIGSKKNPKQYARFDYNAQGLLVNEILSPSSENKIERRYQYNSPGMMTRIEDNFFEEELDYFAKSYGDAQYGNGLITCSEFKAKWHGHFDNRKIKKGTFPKRYRYQYQYGIYGELIKAKYTENDGPALKPLHPSSFSEEISGIDSKQSDDIWKLLNEKQYIIIDAENPAYPSGKLTDLNKLLVADFYSKYPLLLRCRLRNLLFDSIQNNLSIQIEDFKRYLGAEFESRVKEAWEVFQKFLTPKGGVTAHFLADAFRQILSKYSSHVIQIVAVLYRHAKDELGQSPHDLEMYTIDDNGNYRHYYHGFSRYYLSYKENTNQIDYLNLFCGQSEKKCSLQHDARGNVVRAEHRNIEKIVYDPVINKVSLIELTHKTVLEFNYDISGNRVIKRVLNAKDKSVTETFYFRDQNGRVLKERMLKNNDRSTPVDTYYLYSPRGLIGFIRDNEFYKVLTDHLGSIRLVVKDDEVLAAYDYNPYGDIIRQFSKLKVPIHYLYTGQEWDEETGLYNFPARLYDPQIGRFYQVDPQNQYFSPYKYAGNAPTVMVDPDGEFTIVHAVASAVLGVAGAYVGGAAANGDWNPLNWNYSSGSTWLGMGAGALAGASIPFVGSAVVNLLVGVGCSTAVATGIVVAAGAAGAYLGGAASQGSWNPTKWDYQDPKLYAGGLQGVAAGIALPMGFTGVGVAIATIGIGIPLAYVGMAASNNSYDPREWDWTNPSTYNAAFQGLSIAAGISGGTNQLLPVFNKFTALGKLVSGTTIIGSTLGFAYVSGVGANNWEWNPGQWRWEPHVVHAIVMGGAMGYGVGLLGVSLTHTWISDKYHGYKHLDPKEIRCCQDYISGKTSDGIEMEQLIDSMKKEGWKGNPVDVVQMEDGKFTTLDHRRIYAADKAGIKVRVRVHQASEPLPADQAQRFQHGLMEPPKTWGEAIQNRVLNQRSFVMRVCYPEGIPLSSLVILPKPLPGEPDIRHHNYDLPGYINPNRTRINTNIRPETKTVVPAPAPQLPQSSLPMDLIRLGVVTQGKMNKSKLHSSLAKPCFFPVSKNTASASSKNEIENIRQKLIPSKPSDSKSSGYGQGSQRLFTQDSPSSFLHPRQSTVIFDSEF